jgi:hypothetical protein
VRPEKPNQNLRNTAEENELSSWRIRVFTEAMFLAGDHFLFDCVRKHETSDGKDVSPNPKAPKQLMNRHWKKFSFWISLSTGLK